MGAVGLSFVKKIKELLGSKKKKEKRERERAGPEPNCLELGFELELVSEPSRAEPSSQAMDSGLAQLKQIN